MDIAIVPLSDAWSVREMQICVRSLEALPSFAQELVELADKTQREFSRREGALTGEVTIGCGETRSMTFLSQQMLPFREAHPLVEFSVYSGNADDIKDRLEKGLLDLGLLMEPVDICRYEFIRMPHKERWGVLVHRDASLAQQGLVTPEDLLGVPLLLPRREKVREELAAWFGDLYRQVEIAGTYNLILNTANMVKNRVGAALCFYHDNLSDELRFVPLSPPLETGTVLVWKKNQVFSPAAGQFLAGLKNVF